MGREGIQPQIMPMLSSRVLGGLLGEGGFVNEGLGDLQPHDLLGDDPGLVFVF